MRMKKMFRRGISYLTLLVMIVGLITYIPDDMKKVQAEENTTETKTIACLGASIIANPVVPTSGSSSWKGSYVYFGSYNENPVRYRVLDSNTDVFGGTTMLLDCDNILWKGSNPSSAFDEDSNVWADSDLKNYLNGTFLDNNFTVIEKNAIVTSTKSAVHSTDGDGELSYDFAPLNGDRVFILDIKEATNESYGYYNSNGDVASREKRGGSNYYW